MENQPTKQQASATPATSAKDSRASALESRRKILAQIVIKSRLACSLPVPAADELEMTVQVWDQILCDMPVRWLDRVFVQAIRGHDTDLKRRGRPFEVSEMVTAYHAMVASGLVSKAEAADKAGLLAAGPACSYCNDTGFKRVAVGGADMEWDSTAESVAVARCHCRA